MSEVQTQPRKSDVSGASAVTHASPLLRSAKVVCQSGEYVCLVRDVSQDGVLLSFLHDVPCEPRIILALGNGQTYPIQRIWSGQEQAGYRFAGSVTVEEFLHERAPFAVRPVRLSVEASARIVDGSRSYVARLLDMSTHGAKFQCATAVPVGRLISFQVQSMGQQLGQIAWHGNTPDGDEDATVCGLQFQEPLTLRLLAQAALRMQPFGPGAPKTFMEPLRKASAA